MKKAPLINKDFYFLKYNDILYVLVSYVVEKERICISNTAEIKLKKKYHDKFKNIAKKYY